MRSIDGLKSREEKTKKPTMVNVAVEKTSKISKKPAKKEPVSAPVQQKQTQDDFLEPVKSFDLDITSSEIQDDVKIEAQRLKKTKVKKEKKKRHTLRWILLVIVVLLIGLATGLLVWGNDLISRITGGQSGIWDAFSFVSENYIDLKTDENGRTNILVFGTSGFDMNGANGEGTHDGSQLTDSIMVVSFNQKTGDTAMVSIPRDLKAGLTCTATGKINEVYWCNNMNGDNEEAGAAALVQKINTILGIDIQYYVHINWETVSAIVDALGGVTVTLDADINDVGYTEVKIQAGVPTTLNGIEAVNLARARHGTIGGDFTRGDSQQKILIAIKDKMLENGVTLSQILNIVSSLGDNLRTNFSLDEIKTGAHLLDILNLDGMRQVLLVDYEKDIYYLTTGTVNGISYVLPKAGIDNYSDIQKYVVKMFSNDPTVYEESTIEVLNGSDQVGVAAAEKETLKEQNITVKVIGDAPEGEYTGTKLYVLNNEKTATKARLEDFYDTIALSEEDLPAGVSSDCDFVIIVGD